MRVPTPPGAAAAGKLMTEPDRRSPPRAKPPPPPPLPLPPAAAATASRRGRRRRGRRPAAVRLDGELDRLLASTHAIDRRVGREGGAAVAVKEVDAEDSTPTTADGTTTDDGDAARRPLALALAAIAWPSSPPLAATSTTAEAGGFAGGLRT